MRVLPEHINPAGKAKRKFASHGEAKTWMAERGKAGQTYRCTVCDAVHIGHVKSRPSARDRLHRRRRRAAQRRAEVRAVRAEREARLTAELEQQRLERRLAIRNGREAFQWQEVIT